MYYNPMKRFIFICLFSVMGFAFAQTAESQTHFKTGLSLGAFWAFNQDKSGGDFEVGLPIIRGEETGFMLRNHFLFSGYGGDGFGQVSVGDKLLIGGYIPTTHFVAKPYGFVSTSLGFFAPDAGIDFSRTLRTDLIFGSSCFLFFGLYGMITGGLTLIWSIEKWSLLKQTAVHFTLQYTLTTACTFLPRIYTTTYKSFVLWTAIFVAIYIVIWLVIYIKIYLTISILNKQLDLRVFQVSKN